MKKVINYLNFFLAMAGFLFEAYIGGWLLYEVITGATLTTVGWLIMIVLVMDAARKLYHQVGCVIYRIRMAREGTMEHWYEIQPVFRIGK